MSTPASWVGLAEVVCGDGSETPMWVAIRWTTAINRLQEALNCLKQLVGARAGDPGVRAEEVGGDGGFGEAEAVAGVGTRSYGAAATSATSRRCPMMSGPGAHNISTMIGVKPPTTVIP